MKKTLCDNCGDDVITKAADGGTIDPRRLHFQTEKFTISTVIQHEKDLCVKCVKEHIAKAPNILGTSAPPSMSLTLENLFGDSKFPDFFNLNPNPKKTKTEEESS